MVMRRQPAAVIVITAPLVEGVHCCPHVSSMCICVCTVSCAIKSYGVLLTRHILIKYSQQCANGFVHSGLFHFISMSHANPYIWSLQFIELLGRAQSDSQWTFDLVPEIESQTRQKVTLVVCTRGKAASMCVHTVPQNYVKPKDPSHSTCRWWRLNIPQYLFMKNRQECLNSH